MKRLWVLVVLFIGFSAAGCTELTLDWAALEPKGAPAEPAMLAPLGGSGPVETLAEWENARILLIREALETHIYGAPPDDRILTILERRLLDDAVLSGAARLYEIKIQGEALFGDSVQKTAPFIMNVLAPVENPKAPVILMQSFSSRASVLPFETVLCPSGNCMRDGVMRTVAEYVFGRYIATPPLEEIIDEGYALAVVYPSEFAPDHKERGLAALKRLAGPNSEAQSRWGAVMAWAWGYQLMIDALERDPDLKAPSYIAYGHSRYAKAALVAAAYDSRIAGVIAHQSGTGGASLNRDKPGESIQSITKNYPHWFAPAYAQYGDNASALPIDQHHLLALIAPRPLLLGNARRDVWSDPNGAFRAAQGANPVYRLYGADGMTASRLDEWRPSDDIAFWIRPGTHGVVEEDWPAFLEFLRAHFGALAGGRENKLSEREQAR